MSNVTWDSAQATWDGVDATWGDAADDPANLAVVIDGTTAQLSSDPSPTDGVTDYLVFRRTPQTGEPFDPETDTPVATVPKATWEAEGYDDENLEAGSFDWQVFGRVGG